jgi:hypothetical protein
MFLYPYIVTGILASVCLIDFNASNWGGLGLKGVSSGISRLVDIEDICRERGSASIKGFKMRATYFESIEDQATNECFHLQLLQMLGDSKHTLNHGDKNAVSNLYSHAFPKVYYMNSMHHSGVSVCITEYLPSRSLIVHIAMLSTDQQLKLLVDGLIDILLDLEELTIWHRDIIASNFIVLTSGNDADNDDADNGLSSPVLPHHTISLLDFTWATSIYVQDKARHREREADTDSDVFAMGKMIRGLLNTVLPFDAEWLVPVLQRMEAKNTRKIAWRRSQIAGLKVLLEECYATLLLGLPTITNYNDGMEGTSISSSVAADQGGTSLVGGWKQNEVSTFSCSMEGYPTLTVETSDGQVVFKVVNGYTSPLVDAPLLKDQSTFRRSADGTIQSDEFSTPVRHSKHCSRPHAKEMRSGIFTLAAPTIKVAVLSNASDAAPGAPRAAGAALKNIPSALRTADELLTQWLHPTVAGLSVTLVGPQRYFGYRALQFGAAHVSVVPVLCGGSLRAGSIRGCNDADDDADNDADNDGGVDGGEHSNHLFAQAGKSAFHQRRNNTRAHFKQVIREEIDHLGTPFTESMTVLNKGLFQLPVGFKSDFVVALGVIPALYRCSGTCVTTSSLTGNMTVAPGRRSLAKALSRLSLATRKVVFVDWTYTASSAASAASVADSVCQGGKEKHNNGEERRDSTNCTFAADADADAPVKEKRGFESPYTNREFYEVCIFSLTFFVRA